MAAGVGEVDDVEDLSEPLPARLLLLTPPTQDGPRQPRPRGRGVAVAVLAVLAVTGGLWQQHRAAQADARAAAQVAAAHAERATAGSSTAVAAAAQRAELVATAQNAVAGAVAGGAAGAPPSWGPADLGTAPADVLGPVDVQVMGTWPSTDVGLQRVAYRLVTGLPSLAGRTPCLVPTVHITAWRYPQGGDGALPCRVMAAGVRGTAQREGTAGTGLDAVRVREVVLVSDGRAASVATWSIGAAEPPLELPALGAAAAALLAAAPTDSWAESSTAASEEP